MKGTVQPCCRNSLYISRRCSSQVLNRYWILVIAQNLIKIVFVPTQHPYTFRQDNGPVCVCMCSVYGMYGSGGHVQSRPLINGTGRESCDVHPYINAHDRTNPPPNLLLHVSSLALVPVHGIRNRDVM